MDAIPFTELLEDDKRTEVMVARAHVTHWRKTQVGTLLYLTSGKSLRVDQEYETVTERLTRKDPPFDWATAREYIRRKSIFTGPTPVSLAGPQTCDVCEASTPGTLTALASGWHPTHSLMWGNTLYPRGPLCPRCALLSRGTNDGMVAGGGPVLFAEDLGDDTRHQLRSSIVQRTGTDPETGTDPRD